MALVKGYLLAALQSIFPKYEIVLASFYDLLKRLYDILQYLPN